MYLKSLTLRGFKSFASSTTLTFEPGITCVVGPNGSGKSNVVDALSWVMGEQGVKSLRGGKMEDVIFAGTSGRPPLGRAEVVLTVDNTDGALPIDYTEVTLSRTMFRNGGSEYAINGETCRLLDIQELLSDSGIGREMHVVVGQGQLDSILAQPRALYHQDPGNLHVEQGRFVGFFDLEMCRAGGAAMQLASALEMLEGKQEGWAPFRAGWEAATGAPLGPADRMAALAASRLLHWREISRYLSYDGTPGSGYAWASPADPAAYRKSMEAAEDLLGIDR